jgi:hypothetical protein
MKKTMLIPLLVCMVATGCTPSAETRIKKQFGIKVSGEATEEQIRLAILEKLPIGTSTDKICAFLDASGFAKGTKSEYYRPGEEPVNHSNTNAIWCSIDYANLPWRLVYVSYGISFQLDSSGNLTNVTVGRGLTGL